MSKLFTHFIVYVSIYSSSCKNEIKDSIESNNITDLNSYHGCTNSRKNLKAGNKKKILTFIY